MESIKRAIKRSIKKAIKKLKPFLPWIIKHKWLLVLLGVLIFFLSYPSLFDSISDCLVDLVSKIDWEFLRMRYHSLWVPELVAIGFILYFFKPWNLAPFFTMDNVIKFVGVLGFILLIHFLFGDQSLLIFVIDYIFIKVGLKATESQNYVPAGYIVGSILAFTALLWGLQLRNKRLEASYNHNLEDRFIRSVDLTGKKDLAIRLGGLAGLQALTHENAHMYIRVWEYLASFLRNPPDLEGWKSFPRIKKGSLFCRRISDQGTTIIQSVPSQDIDREIGIGARPDIAHITQILRKQNEQQRKWKKEENFYLPLSEIHLEGANLIFVYLERADLSHAHLEGAYLINAHLEEAFLSHAHLEGTFLSNAHLEGAFLYKAHLEGADLMNAHLERANLSFAQLEGVFLMNAHLEGAYLNFAYLEGASLRSAHLDGTYLTDTDLSKAKNLIPQQFIGKKCRYRKGQRPSLPEEWSQEQREQVLESMEKY